jgi:hypothetical protein
VNAPPKPASPSLPDVRDGLTELERTILLALRGLATELGPRGVSSAMLYGRVCERLPVNKRVFEATLRRLVGR